MKQSGRRQGVKKVNPAHDQLKILAGRNTAVSYLVLSFQIMEPSPARPPVPHSTKPLISCNLLIINSSLFGWLCAVALPLLGLCGQARVGIHPLLLDSFSQGISKIA